MGLASKNRMHLKLIIEKKPSLNYSKILGAAKKHTRSDTKLKELKGTLIIEISATDLAALRASANSILRDIQVIESTDLKVG